MFTYCVAFALVASGLVPAKEAEDPFEPEVLVQAKAVRVVDKDDGDWQEVTFQIEHVYCGDVKMKGTTFEKTFKLRFRGVSDPGLEPKWAPPIKTGEIGIWYMQYVDGGYYVPIFNSGTHDEIGFIGYCLEFPIPARRIIGHQDIYTSGKSNHIHYPSALKWAHTVEKVYRASRADRLKMLREYVYSDNPYVAAWSVRILSDYKPSDLIQFLDRKIEDPKLPIAAQVTIDDILCKINRKKWIASKQRATLLERWVSGEIIETLDVLMIAARIKDALKLRPVGDKTCRELDWNTWLPLMEKWVVQQHLSPEFEDRLYGSTLKSVDRILDRGGEYIFTYSIRLLRTSDNLDTQRFSAEWLERLNLTNSQLKTIEEVKDKIANRDTRRRLEELIKVTTLRLR